MLFMKVVLPIFPAAAFFPQQANLNYLVMTSFSINVAGLHPDMKEESLFVVLYSMS